MFLSYNNDVMEVIFLSTEYLFNSGGEWICFKSGKYLYDKAGKWIGWLPWDNNEVVTKEGKYLGTIYNGNRIYRFSNKPYMGYPGYPGYPGYSSLPSGASDIIIPKTK